MKRARTKSFGTTDKPVRSKGLALWLLAAALAGGMLACDPFSFFEELDGSGGVRLEISPLAATMPVNGVISFTVKGGFPPYELSATAGSVSPSLSDPAVWLYTAPNRTGEATVTVIDSRASQASAEVTIIMIGPLFLTPAELSLEVGHSAVLTAVGGSPHPVDGYSFSSSGGTLTKLSPSEVLLSDLSSPGSVTVTATDDAGATSDATVTAVATVPLAISPSSTTMVTGKTLTLTAYGGQPPYSFSTSAGASHITEFPPAQAVFTAPAQTDTFTVTVTDGASSSAVASVTVEASGPLAISPSAIVLLVNQKVTFGASGGVGPSYTFAKIAGDGALTTTGPAEAEYTAPSSAGSATIQVSDSDSPPGSDSATVTVLEPLAISPVSVTITAGRSYTFSASGGDSNYTYSVVSGGGSFVGATYTAPPAVGSATVRVTDGLGSWREAAVTISSEGPLTISPTEVTLRRMDVFTFQAFGGQSPYSYSVPPPGAGSIAAATGAFTAGELAGTCTVRVTDSAASSSEATVSVVWLFDTIDSSGDVGKHASLAVDAAGSAHVSYWSESNKDLKYAHWDWSGWDVQTVDSGGDVGEYSSLALDSSGYPHVAYYDGSNKDLKYAYWNGSGWVKETVDGSGDVGRYASLALDAADHPHISYWDEGGKDLEYAHWNGSSWVRQTVNSGGDVGQHSSLAVDSSGHPHVAYYDAGWTNLRYAYWNGSSWDDNYVDGLWTKRGQHCSLALDSADRPAISYYDENSKDLRYVYWDGSSWDDRVVESAGSVGMYSSLVLDAAGRPYITYWDEGNKNLKVSRWNGSGFDSQVVDGSGGDVGEYSSIAIDAAGRVKVVYYDAGGKDLLFAE